MPTDVCFGGDIGMYENITDTQMGNIWLRPRIHVLTTTRGIVLIAVI